MVPPIDNKVIIFLYRRSRTFFTANGGLFVFAVFQPATEQARLWVAANIRELALEIFTANGGLFVFAVFQPATRQARLWVAANIRELALEMSPATHGRIGQSPEKPQIFLYLFVIAYSRIKEIHTASNAYG